jgi:acyl-CoA reductase-like NAD-dependent aldehyde dehydrogenase
VIAKVAAGGEEDIDEAVLAARAAFKSPEWRSISAADRGVLLWKLSDLCKKNAHILATIDAWDNGKPYQQAFDEDIAETISVFRYYSGWADKVYGQTIDTSNLKLAYTKHEPLGIQHCFHTTGFMLTVIRCLRPDHSLEFSNYGEPIFFVATPHELTFPSRWRRGSSARL